ncbi:hypothetical protein SSBR45G_19430 [Bradyrhizobium sp. SSBR45G]|uniref:hypothetical protein n=1 Tax=unclassified Bradyrhizobium TaxID=2631580 RepID=UPI002342AA9E|nr:MULTISPECIES: hypothetical protein [unclassified Bradyrhizobium]GLH77035.1 hypothetical protein SSBR45G_19430 [Bradyrhizobium sp. SSBR45G]GLH83793.1 hypothetical protein SSBR45R_12530 [Bradyrhizobium sp. SSBR45R]
MRTVYRSAQRYVTAIRFVMAGYYLALSAGLLALALWLAWPFDGGWLWTVLVVAIGGWGAAAGFKGAELLLSTRPAGPQTPLRPYSIETRKEQDQRREQRARLGR